MPAFRYDLGRSIASFDFYSWLVQAAAEGATEIVFKTDHIKTSKWPEHIARKRFNTIIAPGPAFLGLPCRIGDDGLDVASPHMADLVKFCWSGKSFPRLKTVLEPKKVKYTVTLRRCVRGVRRNSNEPAWRAFAKKIGAHVIEDYDVRPIHLHERMAYYAGAEMNFGVINGPMHIIALSEYPMMVFGEDHKDYISFGQQYPWLLNNQRLTWKPDTYENLMDCFERIAA